MNFHLALSAPLPWLTAASRLFHRRRQIRKQSVSAFFLPRTLSFTKEGKRFIAILLVIGIAAINTGNNLLYLIVAMMLSFIIVSGVLSESTLRGIDVSRILPRHIFAKKPVAVRWTVVNKKGIFPSFSLSIEELPQDGFTAESGYVIKLPARTVFNQTHFYTFHTRGFHPLDGFKVKTRFPFGFFLKGRRLNTSDDVLVYPNIKSIKDLPASNLAGFGLSPARVKGQGVHLYSIRDYTFMDDSRFIHWKSTAKTTRLMAKEFEKEGNKRVKIVFYNALPESHHTNDREGKDAKDEFENLVEDAATLADYFIRSGFEVGFQSLTRGLPCKSGREQLYKILRELAVIEPVATGKNMSLEIKVISQ